MTQEEYNALTDEEQNALVATEVLGWIKGVGGVSWYTPGNTIMEMGVCTFDPNNNLDQAMMGVDKLEKETFTLEWIGKKWWACIILDSSIDAEWHSAKSETPNQAIMLACLRAKGVVE